MFALLSDECVSATPRRNGLYISVTIHICALIALTWFSLFAKPGIRFKVIAVHAGTPEPVRNPQPIYTPVRTVRTSLDLPGDLATAIPPKTGMSPLSDVSRHDGDDGGAYLNYTPTVIPSDLLGLLDLNSGMEPGPARPGARIVSSPIPLGEGPLSEPPEPPPGDPDVQPPLIIGGRLEPAELIEQTKPVYPALARTARVEGTVDLEGTITEEGKVKDLHVVSGHPMLIDAAIKAVEKWRYRPAKLNGRLISCMVNIKVRFRLEYPQE
jgi:TonB family protein